MSRPATAKGLVSSLDPALLLIVGLLLGGGLVMLSSASVALAERSTGDPFFYVERQAVAALLGIACGAIALRVPTDTWERAGLMLPCLAMVLLAAVLIPGLGNTVNGSTRWLRIGGINIQAAEPARLLLFMWIAGYAVRHSDALRTSASGFVKPMLLIGPACLLLLLQPDFGSAVVLMVVSVAILFVAGARIRDLLLIGGLFTLAAALLVGTSDYRLGRVLGFMDPWADPYAKGFQLVQSLIAVGSGEWAGLGLGNGVQKLFYLPEAHTDFVFAVIAEEFGLLGSVGVILLFGALTWRALQIARASAANGRLYQANLAFGIAAWQGLQAFINVGVNMGVLPTKGLPLPLVSYGRSSMIVTLIALALLLRIDWENRQPVPRKTRRRRVVA
ncbi:MAG: putative lipid II flippase FtsW [Chromatiales bacterium]|nr:MAG: putative lipid II flippase FtsW [Chromatiales bacterium]